MKLRDVAELFDVSSEELIRTIATEVYDRDLEFTPERLPDEVLHYHEQSAEEDGSPPNDNEKVLSWFVHQGSDREGEKTTVRRMIDRGKIGLGIIVLLYNSDQASHQMDRMRGFFRNVGESALRDGFNSVKSQLQKYVKRSDGGEGWIQSSYFSFLPGVTTIYLELADQLLSDLFVKRESEKGKNGVTSET